MHKTMERLYEAAKKIRCWEGQSELARRLNQSPQTVKNWETRGVSKDGMLIAQEVIGCSAVWLKTGAGSMYTGKGGDYGIELSKDDEQTLAMASYLPPDRLSALIDKIRAEAESRTALLSKLTEIRHETGTIEPPKVAQPPDKTPQRPPTAVRAGPPRLVKVKKSTRKGSKM